VDFGHAKLVCEACFLGVASEGLTAAVNPSVQGVGIGNKIVHRIASEERSLQVYVDRKLPEQFLRPEHRIPDEIEGVPTDVVETGVFAIGRRFPPIYQRRVRPAPAGVSLGHYKVSAGTFGALVRHGGETYLLSNNHVLANEGRGQVGDPVLQPGTYDGGRVDRDTIAHLAEFAKLDPEATNAIDAAIATPVVKDEVAPEILNIGRVLGEAEPEIGMAVRKSGRTTRLTRGRVSATDVTLRVGYAGASLVFTDQFFIEGDPDRFSGAGDSGSVIVDDDRRAVGLLFAGSPFVTVANRWSNVAKAFDVKPIS